MDALEPIFEFLSKLAEVSPINAIMTLIILCLLLIVRMLLHKIDAKDEHLKKAQDIIEKNTEILAKQHTMFEMLVNRINADQNRSRG